MARVNHLRRLEEVLEVEQLTHPASAVAGGPWPKLASRHQGGRQAALPAGLAAILEHAYGYRMAGGRLGRGAASAGAMYPIDIVVLTGGAGAWRALWYDFAGREAREISTGNGASAAALLGLRGGESALLVVAVLGRTVRRYGMRGYRYCLLDAGNVAGNVTALTCPLGARPRLVEIAREDEVARALDLTQDEVVAATIVLEDAPLADCPPPAASRSAPAPPGPATADDALQRATVCAAVDRIRVLHGETTGVVLDHGRLAAMAGGWSAPDVADQLGRRASARNFAGGGLPPADLDAVSACAGDAVEACGEPWTAALTVRLAVVDDDLAGRLQASFGGQALAARASAMVVLGLLWPSGSDAVLVYRRSLLLAGMVCASLYRLGAARGLATTSFGGFSDRVVGDMVGGGLLPLVVQGFGAAACGDLKSDVVDGRGR